MSVKRRRRSGALWTILYRGSDPFGGAVLPIMEVLRALSILIWAKLQGLIDCFSAHDDDLVGWDPSDPEDYLRPASPMRIRLAVIKFLVDTFKMPMHMITCSLHGHTIFTAGGFTNRDAAIRMLAIKKALRAAWIGNYLGAEYITYWVARDGEESIICDAIDSKGNAYVWLKQALNLIAYACKANNYTIKHGTIEPKVNEPRSYSFVALVATALALISELDDPEFWGVNPEVVQHASMGNQSPYLEIKHAIQMVAGKLFFLHVGGQVAGQLDNDFPMLVGENKEVMILILRFLAEVGWDGVIEFDCHPLRSDLAPGLGIEGNEAVFKEFIQFNVEMYTMVEQRLVPRLQADTGLQQALATLGTPTHSEPAFLLSCELTLAMTPSAEMIEGVITTTVPAEKILQTRQDHLAVERALNLVLYGVSETELAEVMPQPADANEAALSVSEILAAAASAEEEPLHQDGHSLD